MNYCFLPNKVSHRELRVEESPEVLKITKKLFKPHEDLALDGWQVSRHAFYIGCNKLNMSKYCNARISVILLPFWLILVYKFKPNNGYKCKVFAY